MYAFVFSGGFADGLLMDGVQTKVACKRIVALMERIDAPGALLEVLNQQKQKKHAMLADATVSDAS